MPEHEGVFAANEAGTLEFGGDAVGGVSGAQHHERRLGRLGGRQYGPGEPSGGADTRDQDEPDDLAHGIHNLRRLYGGVHHAMFTNAMFTRHVLNSTTTV